MIPGFAATWAGVRCCSSPPIGSQSVRPAGGERVPARRQEGLGVGHTPVFEPGQMRVNMRTLSGKVVKIGSAYRSLFVGKQWKYFVLYVDHRAPIITGTTGRCLRKIFCSCVAIFCCFFGWSETFH